MRFSHLFFCVAFLPFALFAQPNFIASLYPTQHGLNIPADAVLRVGLQKALDPTSLSDSSIYVWSDITGLHKLTVTLENGNKNLRIVPRHWRVANRPAFNAGERVTVTVTTRLRYADGKPFDGFVWHYTVAVKPFTGTGFKSVITFGGGASSYFYVSDFNGDGWPDIVGNDDGIYRYMIILFNDRKGIFTLNQIVNTLDGRGEVVDQDRDGDQDIFFGLQRIVVNDGIGRFQIKPYSTWPLGQGKMYDFNNDGVMDFVISTVVHDTVFFGVSDKGKAFAKRYYARSPLRLEFYRPGLSYDLNNDGRVDLISGGVREPVPLGFVSFQDITEDSVRISQFFDTQFQPFSFCGNDFDGDGYIDYAMVGGGPGRNIEYRNNGRGILAPHGLQRDSTNNNRLFEAITGGDWDGDGDIDLAFANTNQMGPFNSAPDVCIYLNDGKGNFNLTQRIPLHFNRFLSRGKFEAVDFDQDGDLDLISVADGLFFIVANGSFATSVPSQKNDQFPTQFFLEPTYPNPFAKETHTELILPSKERQTIEIAIFDIAGRAVRSWRIDSRQNKHAIVWNGRDQKGELALNGLYFFTVRIGNNRLSQKVMLLR